MEWNCHNGNGGDCILAKERFGFVSITASRLAFVRSIVRSFVRMLVLSHHILTNTCRRDCSLVATFGIHTANLVIPTDRMVVASASSERKKK